MLNSRKKARVVVGVVFLLLLIVGSSAGYFLSQQSQDIRQQAMGGEDDTAYPIITSELESEEELIETEYQDRDTCKLRCDGVCEGSTCITQVIEINVTIEDFEEIEEEEEKEQECTDSWCRGSNLENLEDSVQEEIEDTEFYDDNYITMNDYDRCVRENSPSECRAILNHTGDLESAFIPVAEISEYDKCVSSGKTGIECESEENNSGDEVAITTIASTPDYLIPPEFDPEDNLSLTQDPMMRASLEAEYLSALEWCNATKDIDQEACRDRVTNALEAGSKTGDTCVAYYMINNPGRSVSSAENQCGEERGDVVLKTAGIYVLTNPLVRIASGIYAVGSGSFQAGGYVVNYADTLNASQNYALYAPSYFDNLLEEITGSNAYYVPQLGYEVEEEYGRLFNNETQEFVGNVEDFLNFSKLDGVSVIRPNFHSHLNTPLLEEQIMIINQESLQSDPWISLVSGVEESLGNLRDLPSITSAFNANVPYSLSSLDEDGYVNELYDSRDSSLKSIFEEQKTVCFDIAAAEYLYLETQNIDASIGVSEMLNHVFIVYEEDGEKWVSDPTWDLTMPLDEHQEWLEYDDLVLLDSIFEPILESEVSKKYAEVEDSSFSLDDIISSMTSQFE